MNTIQQSSFSSEVRNWEWGITAILAMTSERVIWDDNMLPWHIPEDMKHFRELTKNSVVIMGKNTYFSLPEKFRPLPGRRNIVFTRGSIYEVETVIDISELKHLLHGEERRIFLIGWAKLYDYFFENNLVDMVELTLLDKNYSGNITIKEFRENFTEIHTEVFSEGKFITLIKK